MATQEAAVRQEIIERIRHKHQSLHTLLQNVSNKLAVSGDLVHAILLQLVKEGVVTSEEVNGVEIITIVKK